MSETVSTEVPAAEVSNAIVEVVEKTLVDFMNDALSSVILMKTEIKLTPELVEIIKNIISQTPNTLLDIEKAVAEIVKDGKINTKDIPQLIIIVQRLYQVIYNLKDKKIDSKKRSEFTATALKFIIQILVLNKKIKIDEDKQVEFLKECEILIDSCIGLLSFPKSLKTKGCLNIFSSGKK
jgi:hypothetical protein